VNGFALLPTRARTCLATSGAALPANVRFAGTLAEAAEAVLGRKLAACQGALPKPASAAKLIRGLFCGGTLCSEAQMILQRSGLDVVSNVPVPGAERLGAKRNAHMMIDLGDDEFTRGRPHPMIEPATRDAPLAEALADETVGVVVLDVVLGWGSHPDPAGQLVRALGNWAGTGPMIVASVVGTEADPQVRSSQVRKLTDAGIILAASNASATEIALQCVR
jgi:FdrA protein